MKIRETKNNISIILLIIIILIFLSFASYSLKKPFTLDEVLNINAVASISEGRGAISYYSEDLTVVYNAINPQLSSYLLAIGYSAFDNREIGTRMVPMMFCVGIIILIYLISKQIFRRNKNSEKIALLSSLLFALSPLVVQNSTLVTSDTMLLFMTMGFVYFYIKFYNENLNFKKILVLVSLLQIIFWTKLANIPPLFLGLFIYHIIDRKFKKGVIELSIIGFLGLSLFTVSWYFHTKSIGVPFLNVLYHYFRYGSASKFISMLSLEGILLRAWTIKNIMFWTTPFFLILVVFAFVDRVKEYIKERKANFMDFFIIFSFFVVMQYFFLYPSGFGFPKHFVAMVPGFSILLGYYISKFRLKDLVKNRRLLYVLLIAVVLVTIFNFVFLKDPFIEHNIFYSKSMTIQNNFDEYLISNLKGIFFFVPFAIIFLVFYPVLKKQKYSFKYIIVVSMFVTVIVSSIYIDYVQAKADYSTKWGYGESGFLETAKYIREHTTKEDLIICRPSIAYYAQRRYYMSYPSPNPLTKRHMNFMDVKLVDYPNNINKLIENRSVPYVVMSHLEKDIYPEPEYYLVAKYGSFTIYKLKE